MSVDEKSTYYDQGGIETIEIIKAKLTQDQFRGYLLGNIIKYSCRRNFKGQAGRDDEKIACYATMLKECPQDEATSPTMDAKMSDIWRFTYAQEKPSSNP